MTFCYNFLIPGDLLLYMYAHAGENQFCQYLPGNIDNKSML